MPTSKWNRDVIPSRLQPTGANPPALAGGGLAFLTCGYKYPAAGLVNLDFRAVKDLPVAQQCGGWLEQAFEVGTDSYKAGYPAGTTMAAWSEEGEPGEAMEGAPAHPPIFPNSIYPHSKSTSAAAARILVTPSGSASATVS